MERGKRVSFALFFLLPLLPVTGWSCMGLDVGVVAAGIGLLLLWFGFHKEGRRVPFWGYPILAIVACWGIVVTSREWPIFLSARTLGWPLTHATLPTGSLDIWRFFLLLFVASGWYGVLSRERELVSSACRGALLGGGIALLGSILLGSGFLAGLFLPLPRQTEIWDELGRPVGTFSDPNAFGVYAALYSVVVVSSNLRATYKVLLFLLCGGAGAVSGSRTFILFECLFFAVLATQFFCRKKLLERKVLLPLLLLSGGGSILIFSGVGELFPSLRRVGETLASLGRGDLSPIMNRLWFSGLSLQVFLDNPVTGVGPLAFPKFVLAYADALSIPLGSWTDNPNNTYLGFLAEFGVLGCIALTLTTFITPIERAPSLHPYEQKVLVAGGIALLGALIFGPHYLFPEVLFLIVLLNAKLFRFTPVTTLSLWWRGGLALFLAISLGSIYMASKSAHYGLYHWEVDTDGRHFRWTSGSFLTHKRCIRGRDGRDQALITVRNGQPHEITLTLEGESFRFIAGQVSEIPLLCKVGEKWRRVRGGVIPVWQPAGTREPSLPGGAGRDLRLLGLQLLSSSRKEEREVLKFDNF